VELLFVLAGMFCALGISVGLYFIAVHYRLHESTTRQDLLAFGGILLTYVGFVLTNFNVLFLQRRMGFVTFVGAILVAAALAAVLRCTNSAARRGSCWRRLA